MFDPGTNLRVGCGLRKRRTEDGRDVAKYETKSAARLLASIRIIFMCCTGTDSLANFSHKASISSSWLVLCSMAQVEVDSCSVDAVTVCDILMS